MSEDLLMEVVKNQIQVAESQKREQERRYFIQSQLRDELCLEPNELPSLSSMLTADDSHPVPDFNGEFQAEITQVPSFLDVANWDDDDAIRRYMWNPSNMGFVNDAAVAWRQIPPGEKLTPGRKGLFVADLLKLLKGYRKLGVYELDSPSYAPIIDLHKPDTPGSNASYSFGTARQGQSTINLSVMNLRFGGGTKYAFSTKSMLTINRGCRTLLHECRYQKEEWRAPNGEIVELVRIVEIHPGFKTIPVSGSFPVHFCTPRYDVVKRVIDKFKKDKKYYALTYPVNLRDGDDRSDSITIQKGRLLRIDGNFDSSALGLPPVNASGLFNAEVAYETSLETSFDYAFTLGGGHDYLGYYRGPNSASYSWAWRHNGTG